MSDEAVIEQLRVELLSAYFKLVPVPDDGVDDKMTHLVMRIFTDMDFLAAKGGGGNTVGGGKIDKTLVPMLEAFCDGEGIMLPC